MKKRWNQYGGEACSGLGAVPPPPRSLFWLLCLHPSLLLEASSQHHPVPTAPSRTHCTREAASWTPVPWRICPRLVTELPTGTEFWPQDGLWAARSGPAGAVGREPGSGTAAGARAALGSRGLGRWPRGGTQAARSVCCVTQQSCAASPCGVPEGSSDHTCSGSLRKHRSWDARRQDPGHQPAPATGNLLG